MRDLCFRVQAIVHLEVSFTLVNWKLIHLRNLIIIKFLIKILTLILNFLIKL